MTPQEKLQTIAAMLDHVDHGCESLGARCDAVNWKRVGHVLGRTAVGGVKGAVIGAGLGYYPGAWTGEAATASFGYPGTGIGGVLGGGAGATLGGAVGAPIGAAHGAYKGWKATRPNKGQPKKDSARADKSPSGQQVKEFIKRGIGVSGGAKLGGLLGSAAGPVGTVAGIGAGAVGGYQLMKNRAKVAAAVKNPGKVSAVKKEWKGPNEGIKDLAYGGAGALAGGALGGTFGGPAGAVAGAVGGFGAGGIAGRKLRMSPEAYAKWKRGDAARGDGVGDVVRSAGAQVRSVGRTVKKEWKQNQGLREAAYGAGGALAGGALGAAAGGPVTGLGGALAGYGAGGLYAKKKYGVKDSARADFGETKQAKLFPASGSTRKPMGKLRSRFGSEGRAHHRAGKAVAAAGGSSKALLPEAPSFRHAPPTVGQKVSGAARKVGGAVGKVGHAIGAPARGLAKAGSAVKKWHGEHYYDSDARGDSDVAAFVRNVDAFTAHLEAMGA